VVEAPSGSSDLRLPAIPLSPVAEILAQSTPGRTPPPLAAHHRSTTPAGCPTELALPAALCALERALDVDRVWHGRDDSWRRPPGGAGRKEQPNRSEVTQTER